MQHEDASAQLLRLTSIYERRLAEMEMQLLRNNCQKKEKTPEVEDNQHEEDELEKLALLSKLHSLTTTVEQQTQTMLAQQAAFVLQKGELEEMEKWVEAQAQTSRILQQQLQETRGENFIMGLCRIVLLTAFAFLVYADPLLAAVDTDDTQGVLTKSSSLLTPTSISEANIIRRRSLRVGKTVDDEDVNDSTLQDRASGMLSKVSSVFDMFRSKNSLVERWVQADKSDEFVLKKLKLTGLAGNALKRNKNYVFFENFVKMRDTKRVNTWLANDVPTYDVWKTLGLHHVRTMKDLGRIGDTDTYKLYMRYAYAFDDRAHTKFDQNNVIPTVIGSEASW
ncbi:hypothetical protein PHMEG_00036441, partial [Phytophthora megakarya]